MSEVSPCLNCGACCSHFRVSFFWGECTSAGGTVPDDLVASISPSRVAMLGTDCKPTRCVSLVGEVGSEVKCSIYNASWENGEANVDCDAARAAFGLPALQPEFDIPYEQSA
jgi:hypothetical protein